MDCSLEGSLAQAPDQASAILEGAVLQDRACQEDLTWTWVQGRLEEYG